MFCKRTETIQNENRNINEILKKELKIKGSVNNLENKYIKLAKYNILSHSHTNLIYALERPKYHHME